jgi:DNA modification methylase
MGLIARLIGAVTEPGDLVVDPAGGSFDVMHVARRLGRNFMGCDIAYLPSADVGRIAPAEQIPVRQQMETGK